MSKFTLNSDDPKTAPLVHQLMHNAVSIRTTTMDTQSTYLIRDAQLESYRDANSLANPLPQLDLKLAAQLVGYDDTDGNHHQVVNMDAKEASNASTATVPLRYHLDTGELIQMLRGGLNDQPQAYTEQLKSTLVGQQFTRPDGVQLSQFTMASPMALTGGLTTASELKPQETTTLDTVSAAPHDYQFDSNTKDNSFTYTLGKVLNAGIEDHAKAQQQSEQAASVEVNPATGIVVDKATGKPLTPDDPRRLQAQADRDTYIKRVQDAKDAQKARRNAKPIENKDDLNLKAILKSSDNQVADTADPDISTKKVSVPSELFAGNNADNDGPSM